MLYRVNVGGLSGMRASYKSDWAGPVCILCTHKNPDGDEKTVDSDAIVENRPGDGKNWCAVLIKCHGQEQLVRFDMLTEHWDDKALRDRLERHRWFDPKQLAGLTEER